MAPVPDDHSDARAPALNLRAGTPAARHSWRRRFVRALGWLVGAAVVLVAAAVFAGYAMISGLDQRAPASAARALGLLGFSSQADFGPLGTFRVPLGLESGTVEYLTLPDGVPAAMWGGDYGVWWDLGGKYAGGSLRVIVYPLAHRGETQRDVQEAYYDGSVSDPVGAACAEALRDAHKKSPPTVILACYERSPELALVVAAADTARGVSVTLAANGTYRSPGGRAYTPGEALRIVRRILRDAPADGARLTPRPNRLSRAAPPLGRAAPRP